MVEFVGPRLHGRCDTQIDNLVWYCRFFKQAPDTSILAENVSFVDHIGPRIGLRASTIEGKKAYSQHMWLLRFHSSLIFSRCEVSMTRHCRAIYYADLYDVEYVKLPQESLYSKDHSSCTARTIADFAILLHRMDRLDMHVLK